jgi:hypothetical protein
MSETSSASTMALLIRLKDKREYLVPQDNLLQLIEFTKTFEAEIHRVNVKDRWDAVLKLDQLPEALCNMQYKLDVPYTDLGRIVPLGSKPTVENKVPPPIGLEYTRQTVRQRRSAIRSAIRERFLAMETVSLNDLCDEFEDQNTSRSSMTNHLSQVRNRLSEEGYTVQRVAVGSYRIGNFSHGYTMPTTITMPRIDMSNWPTAGRISPATPTISFNWDNAGPTIAEAISQYAVYNGANGGASPSTGS